MNLKKSVGDILNWYAQVSENAEIRLAANNVLQIMQQYEQQKAKGEGPQQLLLDFMEEEN